MQLREFSVQGKKVLVCDQAFSPSELGKARQVCSAAPLARDGATMPGKMDTMHYVAQGQLEVLQHSAVLRKALELAGQHYGGTWQCQRVIYREIVYGDHVTYHVDAPSPHVTAMVYVNEEWMEEYRGETLFVDDEGLGVNVLPKPGRLVLFDASIRHTSSPPSRTFYGARKILVFNLKP